MHCAHADQYGVCSTCFGELSLSIPMDTNLGQITCTTFSGKQSQIVLSTKHLDNSAAVEAIVLELWKRAFLKVADDENSYILSDAIKNEDVRIVVYQKDAANINDIYAVKTIEELNITRVSELTSIGIRVMNPDPDEVSPLVEIDVSLNRRLASFTYEFLHYIRAVGMTLDVNGNYEIDLKDWDWSKKIMTLPLRHINMSDHSRDVAMMLESSVGKMQERDQNVNPDAALVELYELVNDQLDINLAVLSVVMYSIMIVSAENGDYSLPKPWTPNGLGVMKLSMANRSLAAAMAFQEHREVFTDPGSFLKTNRPNHPMDMLVMPGEISKQMVWKFHGT